MKKKLIVIIGMILLLAISAAAKQPVGVTLTWDANQETDLAGYRIYYYQSPRGADIKGPADASYPFIDVGNVTTYMIPCPDPLTEGMWYFSATTYDSAGNESVFSNEVKLDQPLDWTAPSAPGGCMARIKWPD